MSTKNKLFNFQKNNNYIKIINYNYKKNLNKVNEKIIIIKLKKKIENNKNKIIIEIIIQKEKIYLKIIKKIIWATIKEIKKY